MDTKGFDPAAFKYFLFDLDGVIYRGSEVIDGAPDTLEALRRNNKSILFLTNHTRYTAGDIQERLSRHGVDVPASMVLTVSQAVIAYLRQQTTSPGHIRVNLIGVEGIESDFTRANFQLTTTSPEFVVAGWDPHLTYEKLRKAAENVLDGAKLIVTSPDRHIPTEDGFELGFGAIGAAISYATNQSPVYIGKPFPAMINAALEILNANHAESLIVGDTPETDIKSHHLSGLGGSILVLTGNTRGHDVPRLPDDQRPCLVLDSVSDLRKYFD